MTRHFATRIPMARVDRLWRDSVVVSAVGPVAVPDRAAAVAAFAALAACGPDARIGLRFDPSSRHHWLYRHDDLAEYAETCVVALEAGADDDVDALMSRLAAEYDHTVPVRIFLADRHVLTAVSHAIGDSRVILAIPPAIVAHACDGTIPEWARRRSDPNLLRAALRRTFGRPSAVGALLAERRATRATMEPAVSEESPNRVEFRPRPVSISVPGPPGASRALRAWTGRNLPGAAHFATVLTAVEQALTEQGIDCAPGVHMMFDLHRYLPRGTRTGGNFVGGLDLPTPVQDPRRITEVVTHAAKVGRPLAAVVVASLWSTVSRLPGLRPRQSRWIPDKPSAQLALSYITAVRVDNDLPWLAEAPARMYWCLVDPAGPTAITLLVAMVGERLQLSACFHATVFDPDKVRSALRAAQDDPIGLVQRAGTRAQAPVASPR